MVQAIKSLPEAVELVRWRQIIRQAPNSVQIIKLQEMRTTSTIQVHSSVEQWKKHFSDNVELHARLAELEDLMRAGALSSEAKGRIRTLSDDIISLTRGAAEAVKLFGDIARMAGF